MWGKEILFKRIKEYLLSMHSWENVSSSADMHERLSEVVIHVILRMKHITKFKTIQIQIHK